MRSRGSKVKCSTNKPLSVRYGLDPAGQVNEVTAQASDGDDDGSSRRRSVTTRLLKDDFGQEVAVISPDSGTVLSRSQCRNGQDG